MRFTKVQGLGNDFILIDARYGEQPDYAALAPSLCDRHTGVGADGILTILPSDTSDIRMRIFNSDGSEAEMCGNGVRCFAKYVYEKGIVDRASFTVETLGGVMQPELLLENGRVTKVRVDMGVPDFTPACIPALCDDPAAHTVEAGGRAYTCASMRVGVPHTVVFVDDLAGADAETAGRDVSASPVFPQGTNVNLVQVLNRHVIAVRTYERGCGCTLACGTGACAAAVACMRAGKTARSVDVQITLGALHIEWAADGHVYMTGPAAIVYTGEIAVHV